MKAAKRSDFRLTFDADEIAELAGRYDYATDEGPTLAGQRARQRGHYVKREFMVVCRWKSARSAGKAELNSPEQIRRATRIALNAGDEAMRMQALISLVGVGIPVASTLLHFACPRRYPILDYRALESLGQTRRSAYTVSFWLRYLEACRRIAQEHHVTLRTLDKALWEHSRETTTGRR
jgi:hypothetical protein